MDSFSYADTVRAALAPCLPCFSASRSASSSNSTSNPSSSAVNAALSEPRSTSTNARPSNDLEHLLRDSDSDALSLHSNLGSPAHRRARHRRRPKFSLVLFGYTLFGRPPIYLSDDDNEDDLAGVGGGRRALVTASSSTLDSDAAPLDASTIERLTSPDHFAALAAQRESQQRRLEVEEDARRKAKRRARRQEREASTLMSLDRASPRSGIDAFEGFQGSEGVTAPTSFLFHPAVEVIPDHPEQGRLCRDGDFDGSDASHSDDDADLGGELYTRAKKPSAALSASGSDSRSRTSASASFSGGDASHIQDIQIHGTHQSIPYPYTEMHLPAPVKRKSHRTSKRTSTVSSVTSQSTSPAPCTPVESISVTPAVAAFPVPQERYTRDRGQADFPSVGLSDKRGRKSLDARAFLAHQGGGTARINQDG